jgi:hypothetical protein
MAGATADMRRTIFFRGRSRFLPRRPAPLKIGAISGVTRDASGAALGNCVVHLFTSVDDIFRGAVISDASGNYSFSVGMVAKYYCVAYLAGPPDVAGTTANTLQGA